jgi:hypothetical protein
MISLSFSGSPFSMRILSDVDDIANIPSYQPKLYA